MKSQKIKAQLYYQDKIFELHQKGKSVREVTKYINKQCLAKSRFKEISLSKSTIHNIIRKLNNVR